MSFRMPAKKGLGRKKDEEEEEEGDEPGRRRRKTQGRLQGT